MMSNTGLMRSTHARRAPQRLLLISLALLLIACQTRDLPRTVPAGQGELLATGEASGQRWEIYCGVDAGSDLEIGFGPAPPRACAPDGHPLPCIHVHFAASSLIRCQLENLPERLIVSHSVPLGSTAPLLFAGATDATVERLEFALKNGGRLVADLIESDLARFRVFAFGVTPGQLALFERPVLFDAAGQIMNPPDGSRNP